MESLQPDSPEQMEGLSRRAPGGVVPWGPGVPGDEGQKARPKELA